MIHGKTGISVRQARTKAELESVKSLFWAYADSLPISLAYQDFDDELEDLAAIYPWPRGGLWLARDELDEPIGCVALRGLESSVGEMKRLFLLPGARGKGGGRKLCRSVIEHARKQHYREIRLDTLGTMDVAFQLYRSVGFAPIAPYYSPTPDGTLFLSLRL